MKYALFVLLVLIAAPSIQAIEARGQIVVSTGGIKSALVVKSVINMEQKKATLTLFSLPTGGVPGGVPTGVPAGAKEIVRSELYQVELDLSDAMDSAVYQMLSRTIGTRSMVKLAFAANGTITQVEAMAGRVQCYYREVFESVVTETGTHQIVRPVLECVNTDGGGNFIPDGQCGPGFQPFPQGSAPHPQGK